MVFHVQHALVAQFAFVHLQREQRENHQTKNRQRHHFGQLLKGM